MKRIMVSIVILLVCFILSGCYAPHEVDKYVIAQLSKEENIRPENIKIIQLQEFPTARIVIINSDIYFLRVKRDAMSSPIQVKQKLELGIQIASQQSQIIIKEVPVPVQIPVKKEVQVRKEFKKPTEKAVLTEQQVVIQMVPSRDYSSPSDFRSTEEYLQERYDRIGLFLTTDDKK